MCQFCNGPHFSSNCNVGGMFATPSSHSAVYADHEQVDYMGNVPRQQNNPYSNTYNPGWKNHPNFGWKDNNNQAPPGFQRHYTSQSQPQQNVLYQRPVQQEKKPNIEELMMKFVTSSDQRMQHQDQVINNQNATIQDLSRHIGNLSKKFDERQQGALPSNTEPNPKEQCQAIITRSGNEYPSPVPSDSNDVGVPVETGEERAKLTKEDTQDVERETPLMREYQPKIPYPARL